MFRPPIERGVSVRVIVDRGKYESLTDEEDNLAQYLTSAGGREKQLRLRMAIDTPVLTRPQER
jgi:hypothetical protein